MSFANEIKEIYNSQKSALTETLDYCEIAPDFDADNWETQLNSLAEYEEPTSILCYGEAGAKGLLSIFSKSGFMFTEKCVYIAGVKEGMKYSDISKISYREETKSGLLGKKVEGFLIIEESGRKKEIKGNIATKPIATFLDAVVQRYKSNPIAPAPQKEYRDVAKIAELLVENQSGSVIYQITPNIPHKKLNKFITHSAKDETKASIAGLIEGERMPTLILSNDFLYCKFSKSEDLKKVNYSRLSKAIFSKTKNTSDDGIVIIEEKVTLFDKDNQKIFIGTSPIEVANLLNKVISLITGQDVQTEIKTNVTVETPEIVQQRKKIVNTISKYPYTSINGFTNPDCIKEIKKITTAYDASEVISYVSDEAIFLRNGFYIKGVNQEGFFEYTQLSKISFYESKKDSYYGKLIFFDKNSNECFNQEQCSYRGFSFSLVERIRAISKEVFSNDIKLEKTEELCHKVDGAAASDHEEEKKTWNDLLSKWDEIFTRDDNFKSKKIEYNKNYDNFYKFQHFFKCEEILESSFVSGNKAIWLKISKGWGPANPYKNFSPNTDLEIIYTPDVNSIVEKLLYFCTFKNSYVQEKSDGSRFRDYSGHLKLSFVSGEHSAKVETKTHRERNPSSVSLEQLLKILGKEDIYNHFSSFVKKLVQEEVCSSEERNRNVTDDLSNW